MSGRKLKQQLKRSAKAGGDGATAMAGVTKSGALGVMKKWEKRKAAKRTLKEAKKAGAWSPYAPPPSLLRHPTTSSAAAASSHAAAVAWWMGGNAGLKEEVKKIAVKQKNLGACPPSAPGRRTCE